MLYSNTFLILFNTLNLISDKYYFILKIEINFYINGLNIFICVSESMQNIDLDLSLIRVNLFSTLSH